MEGWQVKTAAGDEPVRRGCDPWVPVIRPECRRTLEQLHGRVAGEWSQVLAGCLPQGNEVEFEGLRFQALGPGGEANIGDSLTTAFTIEGTAVGGFLRIGTELAACLVETQFGLPTPSPRQAEGAPFTRLGMALLQEHKRLLLESLGQAYAAAGIGNLGLASSGPPLRQMAGMGSGRRLAVFPFRFGGSSGSRAITVAAHPEIINLVREPAPPAGNYADCSPRSAATAAEAPLEVEVVLGAWTVPLDDLLRLKLGETLVLPDGDDAWLVSGGVRLGRVKVRLSGRGGIIEPIGSANDENES